MKPRAEGVSAYRHAEAHTPDSGSTSSSRCRRGHRLAATTHRESQTHRSRIQIPDLVSHRAQRRRFTHHRRGPRARLSEWNRACQYPAFHGSIPEVSCAHHVAWHHTPAQYRTPRDKRVARNAVSE
eukprot:1264106-Rhodomonas_salina.2